MWKDKFEELKKAEGVKFKEYAGNTHPTKDALEKLDYLFEHRVPKILVEFLI